MIMKKKIFIIFILTPAILFVTTAIILGIYVTNHSDLVYSEVFVEAGTSDCDVTEFLKDPTTSARFSDDSVFDPNVPGDYELTIICTNSRGRERSFTSTLHVQDTTAPTVTLSTDQPPGVLRIILSFSDSHSHKPQIKRVQNLGSGYNRLDL